MGWETDCQRETEHDMPQTLQSLVNFGRNHGTLGCKNIKMLQYDNIPELKNVVALY